jgi:hypothetical protein
LQVTSDLNRPLNIARIFNKMPPFASAQSAREPNRVIGFQDVSEIYCRWRMRKTPALQR